MSVPLTISFCEECGGEILYLPGMDGKPSRFGGVSNGWGHTRAVEEHLPRPIRAFPDRSSPAEVEEWLNG